MAFMAYMQKAQKSPRYLSKPACFGASQGASGYASPMMPTAPCRRLFTPQETTYYLEVWAF